jgi:hypothetical protein
MFDRPIGGFQLQQARLAEMVTEIVKAQLVSLHLGRLKDRGTIHAAAGVARQAKQRQHRDGYRARSTPLLGANGILAEYASMRHMANLESVYTYEGTHDVHTLILGQAVNGHQRVQLKVAPDRRRAMAVDDGDHSLPVMPFIRAGVARTVARVAARGAGLAPVLASVARAQQAAGPSIDAAQRVHIQPPWRRECSRGQRRVQLLALDHGSTDKEYTNGDQVIIEIAGAPMVGQAVREASRAMRRHRGRRCPLPTDSPGDRSGHVHAEAGARAGDGAQLAR